MAPLTGDTPAELLNLQIDDSNSSYWDFNRSNIADILTKESVNATSWLIHCNQTNDEICEDWSECDESNEFYDFQIIKAAVLIVVLIIVMISVGKMVFQLFGQYAENDHA